MSLPDSVPLAISEVEWPVSEGVVGSPATQVSWPALVARLAVSDTPVARELPLLKAGRTPEVWNGDSSFEVFRTSLAWYFKTIRLPHEA